MSFRTNPTRGQQVKQCERTIKIENHIQKGNDFSLTCYSWVKLALLKQMIRDKTGIPVSDMKLTSRNIELNRNNLDIQDYDLRKNAVVKLKPKLTLQTNKYMINAFDILEEESDANTQFQDVKCQVETALNSGIIPKLTDFGTQGTYFLEDLQRNPVAVFKPQDEEAFAPNNPRGYKGEFSSPGLRSGVLSGEGVDREVATFLIDQAYGSYHNVPTTTYIEFCHPSFKSEEFVIYQSDSQTTEQISENVPFKRGSFQVFIKHEDNSGNYGSSLFSIEQAHKIAILDLRIFNCDRNEENLLVKKRQSVNYYHIHRRIKQQVKQQKQTYDFFLIPIDHGYSFPDTLRVSQDEVVWFHWSQMQQPFTAQELALIKQIDPQRDVQLIRSKLKFREICLRNFRIAEMLLKEGAASGLNLYHIAQLAFREDPDEMSHLEKAVQRAEENYELNLMLPTKRLKNGSPVPTLLKHASSDRKSSDVQVVQDKPANYLGQIAEENESSDTKLDVFKLDESYNDSEESPAKDSNLKMIKRSISQPSLLLTRQSSSSHNGLVGDRQKKQFTEEFYPHVAWFISILIEQKLKQVQVGHKKNFRERYRSDDL